MRPAQSEVHDGPPLRGLDDTHRLRGEHRLHVDLVHHERLDELCLADRRVDFENWLVREDRRAFRDRKHVAREAQALQVPQESIRKAIERREVPKRRLIEAQRLQKRQHVVETAGEKKIPSFGQASDEQAERCGAAHLLLEVRLEHRERVEVRREDGAEARSPGHQAILLQTGP